MTTATRGNSDIPQSALRVPHSFWVEWEPRLVEEAVLRAVRGREGQRAFRLERNRLYKIEDAEARDAAFRELHATWFERLDLGRVIWQALHEQPLILASTRGCGVTYARAGRDEGAELFVSPPEEGVGELERRSVVIRLEPETLMAPGRLLEFLRHELLHIADMLDPGFGYEPRLPQLRAGPIPERLLRDRYRIVWDAWIDGRLARLGWAPASIRGDRLREFAAAFPMSGEGTEEAFGRFFDGETCTHAELVVFALDPEGLPGGGAGRRHRGEGCPLCRFPTHVFEADPSQLPEDVLRGIRADFPDWDPGLGLCQQCAELYRARAGTQRLRASAVPLGAPLGEGLLRAG